MLLGIRPLSLFQTGRRNGVKRLPEHTAKLLTMYNRIDSKKRSQSANGIRDRTAVDLY